jgi:hypothetical protein
MLQRETIESDPGSTVMPWADRLTHRHDRNAHPHTIEEFAAWPQLDKTGRYHLAYLKAIRAALADRRPGEWTQIFAIGPFVGRKRRYATIPLIFITPKADLAVNLHDLGERLAEPYLDHNILPDIHLLSEAAQQSLERAHDEQWEETKRVSIRLLRS